MRYDFGRVLRDIRKSKGLTQAQVCGDFISRVTLSKIENNKELPNIWTMEQILRQLDMTFAEFDYICHDFSPSRRSEIIKRFENNISIVRKEEMQQLIADGEAYLKLYQDIRIETIVKIAKLNLMIRQHGDSDPSQALAQQIWQELEKCDTWYLADLRKLSAVLILFSPDRLLGIVDKILDSLAKYRDFKDIRSSQFSLLANVSSIFFHSGHQEECLRVTQVVYDIAQESLRIDHLGFANVRMGILRQDKKLIDKGLAMLRVAELHQLADNLEQEAGEYRSS